MAIDPRDLRVDPPRLQASERLGHQLASLAAASVAKPAGRRGGVVASVTAAVLALGVGTAWASGSIEVPGLPTPGRHAPAPPDRDGPATPDPTRGGTDDGPASERPTTSGAEGDAPGGADRPAPADPQRPGGAGTPMTSGGPGGVTNGDRARPDRPSRPAQPARPDRPGKPAKPEKPSKPDKPAKPEKPSKPERPGKGGGSTSKALDPVAEQAAPGGVGRDVDRADG